MVREGKQVTILTYSRMRCASRSYSSSASRDTFCAAMWLSRR